jgi:hypothetical protein
MNTNNDLINELQDFMFNEENIKSYLSIRNEYFIKSKEKQNENSNKQIENINKKEEKKKPSIYFPGQQDSLFWCYYIIVNGDVKYEMLQNKNFLLAKQMKIELVDKIRKNKDIVKMYKFDTLSGIESNLANDATINSKTFCTLCAIENINVIFIKKNTYFSLMMNDTDLVYIVKEVEAQTKYVFKYGFELVNKEKATVIVNDFYKIENINKPIKCESSYKVQDLLDISSKLGIELNNNDGKKKTKKEMYELIIQYF